MSSNGVAIVTHDSIETAKSLDQLGSMTKDGSFFWCLHMVYDTQPTIVDGIYKPIYPLVMTNIAIEHGHRNS